MTEPLKDDVCFLLELLLLKLKAELDENQTLEPTLHKDLTNRYAEAQTRSTQNLYFIKYKINSFKQGTEKFSESSIVEPIAESFLCEEFFQEVEICTIS